MGIDYALVHLKFTVPPAILLTLLYWRLLTRLDVYKILFLIATAVIATTPWDSYLIRTNIWSYPSDVIIGPKFFDIPLEELFFFVIQTYNTTLLYLLLSKPTFHPIYLRHEEKSDRWKYFKLGGQLLLTVGIKKGINYIKEGKEGTYLGLILVWALPFLLLLWSLAYQFILGLPLSNTYVPIILPTVYLWLVDTLALKRGTWVIETGTKLGIHLWPHLEIEEAVFFLLTNTLIVFGLIAFDNAIAIIDTFPHHFPTAPALPSPAFLVCALLLPVAGYDAERIAGLSQAVARLRRKSRSFYLASGAFQRRLRIDLIILYSFCRVADDLVDNAPSTADARKWIKCLRTFLDHSYKSSNPNPEDPNRGIAALYVTQQFPKSTRSALLQLPRNSLSPQPLYDLLKGFEMDLEFNEGKEKESKFPIKTEHDLDLYGSRVAGTVAQLCIELVLHHYPRRMSQSAQKDVIAAGGKMGIALQYTNIARDLAVDASINRIYVPTTWLKQEKLTPEQGLIILGHRKPAQADQKMDSFIAGKIETLRSRLLDRSFALYEDARGAIEKLPTEARGPMRVAVESYMEIGRVLRQKGFVVKRGRATVPKWRRIKVAWKALG